MTRTFPLLFALAACGGGGGSKAARPQAGDEIARCDAGDSAACVSLARQHGFDKKSPKYNAPLAFAYYKKACDRSYWDACEGLGHMHSQGAGTPEDEGKALEVWGRGCGANHAQSCFSEAHLLNFVAKRNDPVFQDDEKFKATPETEKKLAAAKKQMMAALRKACGLKYQDACYVLEHWKSPPFDANDRHQMTWNLEEEPK
jgi:TPR repeat protein